MPHPNSASFAYPQSREGFTQKREREREMNLPLSKVPAQNICHINLGVPDSIDPLPPFRHGSSLEQGPSFKDEKGANEFIELRSNFRRDVYDDSRAIDLGVDGKERPIYRFPLSCPAQLATRQTVHLQRLTPTLSDLSWRWSHVASIYLSIVVSWSRFVVVLG